MQKTFIPSACQEVDDVKPEFEGSIEVKLMSFPERCRMPKLLGIENLQGLASEDEGAPATQEEKALKAKKTFESLEVLAKGAELIEGNILKVELKHIESGDEITTAEALYVDPRCGGIMTELVTKFTFGFAEKK